MVLKNGITTIVSDIKLLPFVNGELNPVRQTLVEILSVNVSVNINVNTIVVFIALGFSLNISTNVCLIGLSSPFTNDSNFMSRTVVVIPMASLASVLLETVHSTCIGTVVVLEVNSFFVQIGY